MSEIVTQSPIAPTTVTTATQETSLIPTLPENPVKTTDSKETAGIKTGMEIVAATPTAVVPVEAPLSPSEIDSIIGEPPADAQLARLAEPDPNLSTIVITEEKPIAIGQSLKQEPTPVAEQPIEGQYTEEPSTSFASPEPAATTINHDSTAAQEQVADIKAKLVAARSNPDFVAAEQAVRNSLQRAEGYEPVSEEEIFRRTMQMAEKYKQRRKSAPQGGNPPISGEAPMQPQDTVINVGLLDSRLEQSRKDNAALKAQLADYEARIAELQAGAAQNQPNAEASKEEGRQPDTTQQTKSGEKQTGVSDTNQESPRKEKNKTYTDMLKEAKDLVEKYVKKPRVQTFDGFKKIHAKTKNGKESKTLSETEKNEYALYKKILWTKLYQRSQEGWLATDDNLKILVEEAMGECNLITALQKVTESSQQQGAKQLASDIENDLNRQLEAMRNNPNILPDQRAVFNENLDNMIDYILSPAAEEEEKKNKKSMTLLEILAALGLITLEQAKDVVAVQ